MGQTSYFKQKDLSQVPMFVSHNGNEKISKKFWAMAAYQNLNSLISIFLITLITPLKKNNLGAKVSVTQDWHLHPPLAVPGRRERKFITQYGCQ